MGRQEAGEAALDGHRVGLLLQAAAEGDAEVAAAAGLRMEGEEGADQIVGDLLHPAGFGGEPGNDVAVHLHGCARRGAQAAAQGREGAAVLAVAQLLQIGDERYGFRLRHQSTSLVAG